MPGRDTQEPAAAAEKPADQQDLHPYRESLDATLATLEELAAIEEELTGLYGSHRFTGPISTEPSATPQPQATVAQQPKAAWQQPILAAIRNDPGAGQALKRTAAADTGRAAACPS